MKMRKITSLWGINFMQLYLSGATQKFGGILTGRPTHL